jgi:hypothetical protein
MSGGQGRAKHLEAKYWYLSRDNRPNASPLQEPYRVVLGSGEGRVFEAVGLVA